MRESSPKRTVCEIIREINDLCQTDSKKDKRIRELCGISEKMAKKLAKELHKYSKEIWKDEKWWKPNRDHIHDARRRVDDNYKYNTGKSYLK